jgi:hypothetical protein
MRTTTLAPTYTETNRNLQPTPKTTHNKNKSNNLHTPPTNIPMKIAITKINKTTPYPYTHPHSPHQPNNKQNTSRSNMP